MASLINAKIKSLCSVIGWPSRLSYMEWGALLWLMPAWGIVIAYGNAFVFSALMKAFLSGLWYPVLLVIRAYKEELPTRWYRIIGTVAGMIILLAIGYGRAAAVIQAYSFSPPFYANQAGRYLVHLTALPETTGAHTRRLTGDIMGLYADKQGIRSRFLPAEGELIAYVDGGDAVFPGDYVWISGTPHQSRSDSGDGHIDTQSRMISDGYGGTVYEGTATVADMQSDDVPSTLRPSLWQRMINAVYHRMGQTAQAIRQRLTAYLPANMAPLAQTLLLGGNYNALDEHILQSFAITGLIHILSVSGSHIALLFTMVYAVARVGGVDKGKATYGAVLLCFLYCGMVGFSPPVMRAMLMGVCMGWGVIRGAIYSSRQAVAISAALLLLYRPLLILDVSFQLSYAATYGIILFSRSWYRHMPKGLPVVTAPVALCLAAQGLLWPLQLYYFHSIGIGSIVAALLVAPLLDMVIVAITILTVIDSFFSLPLLWYPVAMTLKAAVFLNYSIARMPWLTYWAGAPSWIQMGIYYILCRIGYYCSEEGDPANVRYEKYILLGIIVVLFIGPWLQRSGEVRLRPVVATSPTWLAVKNSGGRSAVVVYADVRKRLPTAGAVNRLKRDIRYYGAAVPDMIILDGVTGNDVRSAKQVINALGIDEACIERSGERMVGQRRRCSFVRLDDASITVRGLHRSFLLASAVRQKTKKALQLKDDMMVIGGTDTIADMNLFYGSRCAGIVYWPRSRTSGEMDPAADGLWVVGAEPISDIHL